MVVERLSDLPAESIDALVAKSEQPVALHASAR